MSLERDLALLEVLAGPEGRRRGALGVTRIAAMAGMDNLRGRLALIERLRGLIEDL
jgi:hypothetical protein